MRDLRHHPLLLTVELVLLFGIGAMLSAHVDWQNKLADAPRAFVSAEAEGALLERLSLQGAVYVNGEFHHRGRVEQGDDGVRSVTVPSSSAAHIFRLQPEDRRSAFERTPGLDFFLEDSAAGGLTRGTLGGREVILLDDDGNDRVYVIDGNLWLHSHDAHELRFVTRDGAPVRVTFVVRGDIYFLDDVRAEGADGSLAFIALPRPGFTTTGGDIWLGDLAYGTLSHIDGYLFAAGDIGGALYEELVVQGAVAAGGTVHVEQGTPCAPSPLLVRHDLRYRTGADIPPGL